MITANNQPATEQKAFVSAVRRATRTLALIANGDPSQSNLDTFNRAIDTAYRFSRFLTPEDSTAVDTVQAGLGTALESGRTLRTMSLQARAEYVSRKESTIRDGYKLEIALSQIEAGRWDRS